MLVCSGACSVSPKGGLMLAISTDMQTPKDIDIVSVYIATDGVPKFDYLGRVLPDGTLSLPSTLAIAEPDASGAQVHVRVIAFKSQATGDATARVLRDIVTTVPHARTALLRVPLNFVDDGSALGTLPGTASCRGARGGAPEGQHSFDPLQIRVALRFSPKGLTSANGTCVSATVDPSSLPSYDATQVYGEAGVTPIGTPAACFDVTTCLAHASPVTGFDPTTCAFSAPAPFDATTFEVALVTPDTGWCLAPGKCYVALAEDATEGWFVQGGSIKLARGYARR